MADNKQVKYKVKCITCRQEFVVNNITDFLPIHNRPGDDKAKCTGSGMTGMVIGPVTD